MATRAIGAQSAPVTLPPNFAPMPAVMRTLAQFDRQSLEGFISVAIGLLDVVDGDLDIELNGDETDHSNSEDDFIEHHYHGGGAGCPISDPGGCQHDDREPDDGY